MQRNVFVLTCLIALLAACGGNNTAVPTSEPTIEPTVETSGGVPTATVIDSSTIGSVPTFTPISGSAPATETPTSEAITVPDRVYATGQATLMLPGTLIAPTTPDPDAGLIFDRIVYEQSGGITGQTLTVEVHSDGTVIRNGVTSTISPDQVVFIDNLLDQINYFGIQGIFVMPGAGADLMKYRVTVERAGASLSVDAQDGLIPPELTQLFSILRDLGS